MDSKFYVSYEAARLLKEKGYDRECIAYYHDNCREVDYSFCGERNSTWEGRCVSAPTKAEAIDWLESKGIIIELSATYDLCHWVFSIYTKGGEDILTNTDFDFESSLTRLEAEEAAIIKALELL
jgi:hypothetical protein